MTSLRWEALGPSPVAGEPAAFDELSRSFADTAANAADARRQLERLAGSVDSSIWRGETAEAFRGRIDELPPRLGKVADSYRVAADGLARYGRVLEDLQARAHAVQLQGEAAVSDQRAYEQTRDQARVLDPATPTTVQDEAVAEAHRRAADAGRRLADLLDQRRAAERAVLASLERAQDLGMRNDPWYKRAWGAVDRWVDDHGAVLRTISGVLKGVSAVAGLLSFIPVLTPIFAPIAVASGAVALLTDAALVATGHGSWMALTVDAALMALPGAGRLASRAVRALRGAKAAEALTETRAAAQALRGSAEAVEPVVTRTLGQVARQRGGTMVGLENRLKTVDSLERKIAAEMKAHGLTAEEAAAGIKDHLRYTMTFERRSLTGGVEQALNDLQASGYHVGPLKNSWLEGNSYKGLNAELRSASGHPVELQFHTPESYRVKMGTHQDYDVLRNLDQPLEVRQAAFDRCAEQAATLQHPPGIEKLGRLVRQKRPA